MINNIITINKTKNQHTSLNTKKRKETRTYDVGNRDSGLGQAPNVARLNLLMGFQPFPLNMFRLCSLHLAHMFYTMYKVQNICIRYSSNIAESGVKH